MSTALVPGSIGAIAQATGRSIAETFLNADVIVLVDTSGSMAATDARGGRQRYDLACEELRKLQASMPGKIGVIAFSSEALFCPGGEPYFYGGGTDLAGALQFVKVADGTVKFIVISDGWPDDERTALAIARTFASEIDAIYVGPENDPTGDRFLKDLVKATRGRFATADKASDLAKEVQKLLTSGR